MLWHPRAMDLTQELEHIIHSEPMEVSGDDLEGQGGDDPIEILDDEGATPTTPSVQGGEGHGNDEGQGVSESTVDIEHIHQTYCSEVIDKISVLYDLQTMTTSWVLRLQGDQYNLSLIDALSQFNQDCAIFASLHSAELGRLSMGPTEIKPKLENLIDGYEDFHRKYHDLRQSVLPLL